jgi:hypothetical protein
MREAEKKLVHTDALGDCGQDARDHELLLVCDDPETIFYGPYPCKNCGISICRASREQGGMAFVYPSGIIYPNTNWVQHVCQRVEV